MATINGGLNGFTRAEQLQIFNNGHGAVTKGLPMIMARRLRRRSRYKGFIDDHGGTVEATEPLQRVYR